MLKIYYHDDRVTSVDVHNEKVVSGSSDYKIQVWNMSTNSKLFELRDEGTVIGVKIVDKSLISCGSKAVRIWSLEDGKLLKKLRLPNWCRNIDLNSERTILAVGFYNGVVIYDFSTLVELMTIELDVVNDVRFNELGTKLIVGQYNGQISVINIS